MKTALQYLLSGDAAATSARLPAFALEVAPPRVGRVTAWMRTKISSWRDAT